MITLDQTSELLDAMRDHGWSETGPDHDPARWLADALEDVESLRRELDERDWAESTAQIELESAKLDLDRLRAELDKRNDAHERLTALQEKLALARIEVRV